MNLRVSNRRWLAVLPVLFLTGGLVLGAAPLAQAQDEDKERDEDRAAILAPLEQLGTAVFPDRIQYLPGWPVLIETRLTNTGRTITLLNVREFDILVRQSIWRPLVWQWSWQFTRRGALPPQTSFTLEPWETRINYVVWNQTDANGKPVPPGIYLIEARIFPYTQWTTILVVDAPKNGRP